MFSLRIELLTGRYVATEYNDRDRAEWPPHPARVFSALVAAFYEGGQPEGGEQALRWLESQPPPQLTFSEASRRDIKTHFVPVNDKALSDAAAVNTAWAKVLAPNLSEKQRHAAEARLSKRYEAAGAKVKKLAKTSEEAVRHVMPTTRTKQPRTFPSVVPADPQVFLTWQQGPPPALRAALDAIAGAVVRIGHSSSLVAASFTGQSPESTWLPNPEGHHGLRWVRPGQLDALNALHNAHAGEQRVMPFQLVRYGPSTPSAEVVGSCFARQFIALRRVDGPRLPITATEAVADTVRRALMRHADDPTPPLISGHRVGGGPLEHDHLAIVPLPYVGSSFANGDLLGVALIPPAGLGYEQLRPLYQAIAKWEQASRHRGHEPRVVLTLGKLGRWELERCLDISPLHNLRERVWNRPSYGWATATP
ncbi:MAG: type I-G CRISPR-associated protein Csb2, partial [Nannocystaceae bacterium]